MDETFTWKRFVSRRFVERCFVSRRVVLFAAQFRLHERGGHLDVPVDRTRGIGIVANASVCRVFEREVRRRRRRRRSAREKPGDERGGRENRAPRRASASGKSPRDVASGSENSRTRVYQRDSTARRARVVGGGGSSRDVRARVRAPKRDASRDGGKRVGGDALGGATNAFARGRFVERGCHSDGVVPRGSARERRTDRRREIRRRSAAVT